MCQTTFKRVEKKYLLDTSAYLALMYRIQEHIRPDQYADYTICNVYYDTEDYGLVRASIDKPVFKEKLRIRSYGTPEGGDVVFLEIKRKYDGVVYKRRIDMPLYEAEGYLSGARRASDGQISREVDYFLKFYAPVPKLYLAYDRKAYVGKDDPDLRITFDTNLRERTSVLKLAAGDWGESLIDDGLCLMEIKVSDTIPMWLARVLSDLKIYPTSFSKYGRAYKNVLC